MSSERVSPPDRNDHHIQQANRFAALSRWTQQLPISVWAVYLAILGVLIVVFNALAWIAGSKGNSLFFVILSLRRP